MAELNALIAAGKGDARPKRPGPDIAKAKRGPKPQPIVHGTKSGFRKGCLCLPCKLANAEQCRLVQEQRRGKLRAER